MGKKGILFLRKNTHDLLVGTLSIGIPSLIFIFFASFARGLPSGRVQETVKWQKKRNFIPKQNTHDLLVGTLSIGIPSLFR